MEDPDQLASVVAMEEMWCGLSSWRSSQAPWSFYSLRRAWPSILEASSIMTLLVVVVP